MKTQSSDSIDRAALSRLVARREDAHQRFLAAVDAERDVKQRVQRLQGRIAEVAHITFDEIVERNSAGHPMVIRGRTGATAEMVTELEAALAEQAALRQRRAEAEAAFAPIVTLTTACLAYAAEQGVHERDVPVWAPPPTATGPAPSSEAIEHVRAEIAGLQKQIRALTRADRPTREETYSAIDRAISDRAARGSLHVDGARLRFASSELNTNDQAVALMALVAPAQLQATLRQQADADAERRGGYSDRPAAERQAHRDALEAELLALERREEEMLRNCEAAGATVDRRPDTSPAACLAVFHRSPATGRVPGTAPPEPAAVPRRRSTARSQYLKTGKLSAEEATA